MMTPFPWRDTLLWLLVQVLCVVAGEQSDDCEGKGSSTNVSQSSSAQEWKKEEFPNPRLDLGQCGRRGRRSWICDPDNIIPDNEADDLDILIESLRLNTTCACGTCASVTAPPTIIDRDGVVINEGVTSSHDSVSSQGFHVAIAIVSEIHSETDHVNELEKLKQTERFARYLQEETWNYGDCDNDAVIVISISYKKSWTSSGQMFSVRLSDWCVNFIYKKVRHQLWAGNYTHALTQMIQNYKGVLNGEMECQDGIRAGTVIFILAMVSFGLCFVISLISFFKQRFKLCEDHAVRQEDEEE